MNNNTIKYNFPKGKVKLNSEGTAYLEYNPRYVNKFNNNANQIQMFIDERVARNLMEYVSFKTGTQEKSIIGATNFGEGVVEIGVPYARYQAYSPRIKKKVGKRGTYPFERMKADKKQSILNQVKAYSRRLNG